MIISGDGSITGLVAGGLPNATVVQADLATGVAGTGPAFSAYATTAQTGIASGVETKILFGTERFDTDSNFASSRFTPTVAGYYQINSTIAIVSAGASSNWVSIFKNGAYYGRGARIFTENSRNVNCTISDFVYCNGTTDYVEIYGFSNGGIWQLESGTTTYFSGFLARAA